MAPDRRSFEFHARIECPIPVYAAIAYLDPAGGGDYDAHTVVAVPDEGGRVSLACHADALVAGKTGTLRVVTCLVNGATSSEQHDYRVAEDGTVDLETMRISFAFSPFLDAVEAGEFDQAKAYAARWPADSREHRIAHSILAGRSGNPRSTISATAVPTDQRNIALSRLTPEEVTVGWGKPAYDHLPRRDALLLAGGELFETGIYAHAEASHVYNLAEAGWKTLSGACGLPAGGGSVVFVIRSDGREVFRSGRLTGGAAERFRVDLSQIRRLELRTEDAGDGKSADWGLWLGAELSK